MLVIYYLINSRRRWETNWLRRCVSASAICCAAHVPATKSTTSATFSTHHWARSHAIRTLTRSSLNTSRRSSTTPSSTGVDGAARHRQSRAPPPSGACRRQCAAYRRRVHRTAAHRRRPAGRRNRAYIGAVQVLFPSGRRCASEADWLTTAGDGIGEASKKVDLFIFLAENYHSLIGNFIHFLTF